MASIRLRISAKCSIFLEKEARGDEVAMASGKPRALRARSSASVPGQAARSA